MNTVGGDGYDNVGTECANMLRLQHSQYNHHSIWTRIALEWRKTR